MDYYDKQKAKINIMSELVDRGWKVYGYKADESDMMVDYWSPAHWDGIAEKDGYILLIDVRSLHDSGRKITKKGYTADYSKIKKLEALRDDPAASEGEKRNCQLMIDNLLQKEKDSMQVVTQYPTFAHANPKRNTWHIEKDGAIIAKGNGLNACYGGYNTEEKEKTKIAVIAFVDRLEKAIADNTELKKEIIRTPVTSIKPVQIERKEVRKGDILKLPLGAPYWQVLSVSDRSISLIRLSKKYEPLTMNQTNHIAYTPTSINRAIENGKAFICELQEVTEYVEKTVYKKTTRKPKYNNMQIEGEAEEAQPVSETVEIKKETEQQEQPTTNNSEVTITLNEEMNGIEIRFNGKPDQTVIDSLKNNGFRWSKRQKMWYAKQSEQTLSFANSLNGTQTDTTSDNSVEQTEPTTATYPDIDIEDLDQYTVSDDLQRRVHSSSMFEVDWKKDCRNTFENIQNKALEVLALTDNPRIIYYLKKYLQSFKKRYYEQYIKILNHKANNPSWAVTGRGNLNARRYNKMQDRYDKYLGDSVQMMNEFEKRLNRFKNEIYREKDAAFKEKMNNSMINTELDKAEFKVSSREIDGYSKKMRFYHYGEYSIVKAWGMFRIFKNGKEVKTTLKTTDTLETAKRYVLALAQQDKEQSA